MVSSNFRSVSLYVPSKEKLFPKNFEDNLGLWSAFIFVLWLFHNYNLFKLQNRIHICDIWTRRRGSFLWHNWHLLTHTDQPIEIFKVFKRIKNIRKWIKNLRKPINKLIFFKFLKKVETVQKYEVTDLKIWGNWSKKEEPFNIKYWETDTKYSEIPQQFWTFEGFPRISKKRKFLKNHFWSVSVLSRFRVTNRLR